MWNLLPEHWKQSVEHREQTRSLSHRKGSSFQLSRGSLLGKVKVLIFVWLFTLLHISASPSVLVSIGLNTLSIAILGVTGKTVALDDEHAEKNTNENNPTPQIILDDAIIM